MYVAAPNAAGRSQRHDSDSARNDPRTLPPRGGIAMASRPKWAQWTGESPKEYLDRLNRERLVRQGVTEPAPDPPPPVVAGDVSHAAMTASALATRPPVSETAEQAREARRRGVTAAIARGEEPGGRFQSLAAALPSSTRAAAGMRVQRLRILKSDVPDSLARETPMAAFMARVRAAAKRLEGQGVSPRCVEATAEACVVLERKRGGFAWAGLNSFATLAGYCTRQIQRAMRWLEGQGLIDVM